MENKIERRDDYDEDMELADPFFKGFFDFPFYNEKRAHQIMKTDIKDNGNGYELKVEVPGFNKNQIALSLDKGYLTISAKEDKNEDEKNKNGKFLRKERFYGSYQRTFYVGDVEEKNINAQLNNGVLSISIPKEVQKDNSSKLIEIK